MHSEKKVKKQRREQSLGGIKTEEKKRKQIIRPRRRFSPCSQDYRIKSVGGIAAFSDE